MGVGIGGALTTGGGGRVVDPMISGGLTDVGLAGLGVSGGGGGTITEGVELGVVCAIPAEFPENPGDAFWEIAVGDLFGDCGSTRANRRFR